MSIEQLIIVAELSRSLPRSRGDRLVHSAATHCCRCRDLKGIRPEGEPWCTSCETAHRFSDGLMVPATCEEDWYL